MQTAQPGDRVQVHYRIRPLDGSEVSSRGRAPLALTVGIEHPRLPGLGLALVGLAPGGVTTLTVPPERAYGLSDPSRVRRWSRRRFPRDALLEPGELVRVEDKRGRHRRVRILQVSATAVVIDANHRWAGQTLEMEVELIAIRGPDRPSDVADPEGARQGPQRLPARGRVVAFDVDAATLAGLRQALPGWQVDGINGASVASLAPAWDPAGADFLVVGTRANATDTVGLCRFLTSCAGDWDDDGCQGRTETSGRFRGPPPKVRRADVPLFVLVLPGQETLVGAVLESGAHRCLLLPIHAEDVAGMLAHACAGNQPGRHTLNLERPQREDLWRDDGGEA